MPAFRMEAIKNLPSAGVQGIPTAGNTYTNACAGRSFIWLGNLRNA